MDLLLLFVPFFALVWMGWGAARSGLLPLDGVGAMNTFVLFFGLPAMVFRLSASGALQQPGLLGLLLAYGLAGVGLLALAMAWAARAGLSHRDGALAALATTFPNTGFLGLPLLTSLMGEQAAGPVAATLIIDVLLLSSLCLAWAHSRPEQGEHDHAGQAVLASLKGALRNPLLWAMALGLLASVCGLVLPHAVDDTLRLLALAASPTALFTLGAMLARAQAQEAGGLGWRGAESGADAKSNAGRVGAGRVAVWAALKLLVHPALVWVFAQGLSAWMAGGQAGAGPGVGSGLAQAGVLVLMMAAALPSASNVSMLAERERADTALVARIILWTTSAAWITLSLWAHGLGLRG